LTVAELAIRLRTNTQAGAARLRDVGPDVRLSPRRLAPPKPIRLPDLKLIVRR
jgi:hypothetical protein